MIDLLLYFIFVKIKNKNFLLTSFHKTFYNFFKLFFYFNSAIRFSALPALNHPICNSFNVWFNVIESDEPSLCLISALIG